MHVHSRYHHYRTSLTYDNGGAVQYNPKIDAHKDEKKSSSTSFRSRDLRVPHEYGPCALYQLRHAACDISPSMTSSDRLRHHPCIYLCAAGPS
jgi:hypothetical protein